MKVQSNLLLRHLERSPHLPSVHKSKPGVKIHWPGLAMDILKKSSYIQQNPVPIISGCCYDVAFFLHLFAFVWVVLCVVPFRPPRLSIAKVRCVLSISWGYLCSNNNTHNVGLQRLRCTLLANSEHYRFLFIYCNLKLTRLTLHFPTIFHH